MRDKKIFATLFFMAAQVLYSPMNSCQVIIIYLLDSSLPGISPRYVHCSYLHPC